MVRVLSVVGNRPQFVKSAPVSLALRAAGIDEVVLHTGQHYDPELSQVFFDELGLGAPRYRLDLRTADPDRMVPGIRAAVERERPDWLLVYGDTNSTLAGARAAGATPVAHVEAGLRSFDRSMPEERNRVEVDRLAALLLCPDERSAAALEREGVAGRRVVVGDVMADASRLFAPIARARSSGSAWSPDASCSSPSTARRTSGPSASPGSPRRSTGSTSRSSSPPTRAPAPRSGASGTASSRSTRSATSTSRRSPRRRA